MYFCLWNRLAVLAEAIFTREGRFSVLKRETLVREVSRRGTLAAAPAAAAGFLHMISFWQQPMFVASCLQKEIPFPLLNEWVPCPGKRKQIKKVTVLPIVQAFWWGFGGLGGDASALAIASPWSGHCLVRGSPSKQGGRSSASRGCLV